MKKALFILITITSFFASHLASGIFLEEPYAPVFVIPDNFDQAEHYVHQQDRVQSLMPAKSDVDIPAYPDAVVFMVHTTAELKQVTGREGLAEVKLIVTDPYDEIVSFYEEKLPEWNFHESLSVFYEGEHEISMTELMHGMSHVSLIPATPMMKELVPDATFMIGVVYEICD